MSYLKNILQEEFGRLDSLSEKYRIEIDALPRGTISIKKRRDKRGVSHILHKRLIGLGLL
jgi:hypothetical protein